MPVHKITVDIYPVANAGDQPLVEVHNGEISGDPRPGVTRQFLDIDITPEVLAADRPNRGQIARAAPGNPSPPNPPNPPNPPSPPS